MNIEKPYPEIKPTDTAIDYSQCYLPFFESKHDGWKVYKCTNCQEINVKKDNRQITIGFCDNGVERFRQY